MFSLLLLLATCVGYYYLDIYYPRETKEKIYFAAFIVSWLTLIYLMNFQEEFIYKMFSQLKEIQKKPRYDLDFFYKEREKEFKEYYY
tara:strand:- start:458 stop:718 length:261 start_codon:yes stop_codon:yes gene_type:complete